MTIYFNDFYRNIDMMSQIKEPLEKFKNKDELLSVLYFPIQGVLVAPHVEVEIEGRCFTLCTGVRRGRDLHDRIKSTEKTWNYPFVRIGIAASSNELENCKMNIKLCYSNITCMQGVSNLLMRCTDVIIPPPISFSPTLSLIYLCAGRVFKPSIIRSIEFYPSLQITALKNAHATFVKVIRASFSIGIDLFICYNLPILIFNNSQIVHAARQWAAS